jgi:hypothetical protein
MHHRADLLIHRQELVQRLARGARVFERGQRIGVSGLAEALLHGHFVWAVQGRQEVVRVELLHEWHVLREPAEHDGAIVQQLRQFFRAWPQPRLKHLSLLRRQGALVQAARLIRHRIALKTKKEKEKKRAN